MKTDTPETDAEWNRLAAAPNPEFERRIAEFARKLERERDEARRELEGIQRRDYRIAALQAACVAGLFGSTEWDEAVATFSYRNCGRSQMTVNRIEKIIESAVNAESSTCQNP